ncbi:MAG: L-lactate dehydrogenase [Oscillospiraceae bacterium]|nr:L-lactate dehydrogenase [Oscillospiraceae bacterium]
MANVDKQKCAIIGCGQVGASIAFTLVQSGLFSELVLIDINRQKAEGEAMDLMHGVPFASPISVYAADYDALTGCGLIILTAGANQKPNETRLDLVHKNTAIFREMIPQITFYNQDAILLVVTNPVDVLTYVTLQESGFPESRVIGTGTVLDTARLKQLVGDHLGVDSRSVHAFIIGEHGDSELAVWSSANISGVDLDDFCALSGKPETQAALHRLYEEVRDSAYEVIKRKGATYYGIAMAVLRIVRAIVRDEHSVLPVSCYIQGHYGMDDLCVGVPAIIGEQGIENVLDIPLNGNEWRLLRDSAEQLRAVLKDLQ